MKTILIFLSFVFSFSYGSKSINPAPIKGKIFKISENIRAGRKVDSSSITVFSLEYSKQNKVAITFYEEGKLVYLEVREYLPGSKEKIWKIFPDSSQLNIYGNEPRKDMDSITATTFAIEWEKLADQLIGLIPKTNVKGRK